jgi:7-cyano-7-deazaguanine tRNA-ribosyltransferase
MQFDPDAVFEIKRRSLGGKLGRLRTKSGVLDTPALFPVIDVKRQLVQMGLVKQLGFNGVITNAYLLLKRHEPVNNIHDYIGFDKVVMTDSGGYQILEFGGIEASQESVVRFQEAIGVDIGVMLDFPTGGYASREHAELTVQKTLENAHAFGKQRSREDILWVGPVQGGAYLDLVETCAKSMASLPFHIHAVGSPTEFLEGYQFEKVLEILAAARAQIPASRPLHLFGAGHPAVLPFMVALGADLFDSASYALYARDDRYMTPFRTYRLKDVYEFPCKCPACRSYRPDELRQEEKAQRMEQLAAHNLHVLAEEMSRIRQAVYHGTLWDLVQTKAYAHPALYRAFSYILRHKRLFSRHFFVSGLGRSGIFSLGTERPELYAVRRRIKEYILSSPHRRVAIIEPGESHSAPVTEFDLVLELDAVYGLVPVELREVYPIRHTEASTSAIRIERIAKLLQALSPDEAVVFSRDLYRRLSEGAPDMNFLHLK